MTTPIRLYAIAHGRSGDKGDSVNVGIIARDPKWFSVLAQELTADRVGDFLKGMAEGPVERFELENLGALNFLVHRALDGGGSISMKLDAQGKTYAQALLKFRIDADDALLGEITEHWNNECPRECFIQE